MEKLISQILKDWENKVIPKRQVTVWYHDESITFDSSTMEPDDVSDRVDDAFKYFKTKDLKYKWW